MLFNFLMVSLFLLIFFADIVTPFGRHGKHKKPCKKYESKMPSFHMYNLRPSQLKCKEYMWKMDERIQIKKHACTKRFFVRRGKRTKPTEYPHMGALGYMSTNNTWLFLCGSSLISEKFVLTSAHCTKVKTTSLLNPYPQIVRLGVTNIYRSGYEMPVDKKIRNIIRHPHYRSPLKYYDIALLELESEVVFTKFLHPACLWSEPDIITRGREFTVTGWGRFDKSSRTSSDLLYAKVDIFNSSICENVHALLKNRNWKSLPDQHICAGKLDGSVDTCNGDSGGPLQYKIFNTTNEGTMHMVVGITTFGSTNYDIPAVYTKVYNFIHWIESHVWPEETKVSLQRIMFLR